MRIERYYYTQSKQELAEVDAEIKKIRAEMTDEEKAIEKKQNRQEAQALLQREDDRRRRTKRILNPERIQFFEKMAAMGVTLAEAISADLLAESKEEYGKICLTTDFILFGEVVKNAGRNEWNYLMRMADDVLIHMRDGAFQIEFYFDFFDEMIR